MRPLYFILKVTLFYSLNLYFRRVKKINQPKKFRDSIIYVSNHPSAFLDPLVVAEFNRPILHFMVRSDVFKWWLKPVTWMVHMLPIYRSIDGINNLEKNEDVFRNAYKILKKKKSIIIFAEGFTDNVFIRSLKPLKKGPARIAFGAMEANNWDMDLKICCVGINYADPNVARSDLVINSSDFIHIKDYKELYEENPGKATLAVTRLIDKRLKDSITYVKNKEMAPLHENIMRLTKKGMNAVDFDASIPLEDRFYYSKNLALKMNELDGKEELEELKENVEDYFSELKKYPIKEKQVHQYVKKNKKRSTIDLLLLFVIGFPIFVVGLVHCFIPYKLTKKFVEKTFKRSVFWGGVKMMLGKAFIGLFNIPIVILLHIYVFQNHWISWPYYFIIPALTGLFAYQYVKWLKELKDRIQFNKFMKSFPEKLKLLLEKRKIAIDTIERVVK